MRQKFDYVFQRLKSDLDTFMEKYPKFSKKAFFNSESQEVKEFKRKKALIATFERYCDQLLVLGFISQRYDVTLIRRSTIKFIKIGFDATI